MNLAASGREDWDLNIRYLTIHLHPAFTVVPPHSAGPGVIPVQRPCVCSLSREQIRDPPVYFQLCTMVKRIEEGKGYSF